MHFQHRALFLALIFVPCSATGIQESCKSYFNSTLLLKAAEKLNDGFNFGVQEVITDGSEEFANSLAPMSLKSGGGGVQVITCEIILAIMKTACVTQHPTKLKAPKCVTGSVTLLPPPQLATPVGTCHYEDGAFFKWGKESCSEVKPPLTPQGWEEIGNKYHVVFGCQACFFLGCFEWVTFLVLFTLCWLFCCCCCCGACCFACYKVAKPPQPPSNTVELPARV